MSRYARVALLSFVCLYLFQSHNAAAQPMSEGTRSGAMGGAVTALDGDIWSRTNPAGRAALNQRSISFFASQGFGLAELRLASATSVFPTRSVTLSAGAQLFGFDEYQESTFLIGLARGLKLYRNRRLFAGLDAVYHRLQIERYGSAAAVGLTAGALMEVIPALWTGIAVHNANRPRFAGEEALDRGIAAGFMYRPYERIRVLADVWKEGNFPASIRAGFEASPVSTFALRAGVATRPVRFSTGVAFRTGPITAEAAAERHDVLGWTPGVALGVQW